MLLTFYYYDRPFNVAFTSPNDNVQPEPLESIPKDFFAWSQIR